jgi:hypothetical protein
MHIYIFQVYIYTQVIYWTSMFIDSFKEHTKKFHWLFNLKSLSYLGYLNMLECFENKSKTNLP